MSTLCEYCREIPFSLLACPTAAELCEARHAQRNRLPTSRSLHFGKSLSTGSDNKAHDQEASVPLGPISRILRYDGQCELCHLFRNIINQRESLYLHGTPILYCILSYNRTIIREYSF